MEKTEMLEILVNFYSNGNKANFASKIGISPTALSNWFSRNSFDAELLYSKCENLSAEWLLSKGRGDMTNISAHNVNNGKSDVISLCRAIVANYQQRDEIIRQLASIIK